METVTTVDIEDVALTAEMVTEAAAHAEARGGFAVRELPDEVYPELSAERTEKPAKHLFGFGKGRNGFRNIGTKKLNLVNRLAQHLGRLQAKGINTDYVLKKFTDWKGPIRTPTKKISGIISQVKEFENA
ncbi:MAG: hypothetical protein PHY47_00140 [Lachnospiraceae bacterium]|nr:hypothetical protein [Lachnospiraceae bacterium]